MSGAGFPQGKINWPFAIAASVALHAAIIGAIFAAGGRPKSAAPGRDAAEPAAPAVEEKIEIPEFPQPQAQPEAETREAPPARRNDAPAPETVQTRPDARTPPAPGSATAAPERRRETAGYTVRAGDSLTKIARKHGCTVAEIAAINGFKQDKMLNIGETIKVPATEREETTR